MKAQAKHTLALNEKVVYHAQQAQRPRAGRGR
jgi:hypothetical protein